MDADVIIIGSGAGGLAAAVSLARAGKKVLVFEQHYLPGGWCHSFPLEGFQFSPGVHYVGELHEGGRLRQIYEGLGLGKDLQFSELNPDAYDHIFLGKGKEAFHFSYPKGQENLVNRLKFLFPEERSGIDGYFNDIVTMAAETNALMNIDSLLQCVTLPFSAPKTLRWGLRSIDTLLKHHIRHPLCRAILLGQAGNHGLPPSMAPAIIHGSITTHYLNGAWYPVGGGKSIPSAMIRALRRHGGEIMMSTTVTRILMENNQAVGVRLQDGLEYRAEHILSNADPAKTFTQLVDPTQLNSITRFKLAKQKWSTSAISLFFAVDQDLSLWGMDSGNHWLYRDNDIEAAYQQGLKPWDFNDDISAIFVTASTLKDPTKQVKKNLHTLEAFTFISPEAFSAWSDSRSGERSDRYREVKEKLIQSMIKAMSRQFPEIGKKIVFADLGTPLTNEFYCSATKGNIYGTEKSRFAIGPFAHSIKTHIKNLQLVGASTLSHGLFGAHLSGLIAAKNILNCTYLELFANGQPKIRCIPAEKSKEDVYVDSDRACAQ